MTQMHMSIKMIVYNKVYVKEYNHLDLKLPEQQLMSLGILSDSTNIFSKFHTLCHQSPHLLVFLHISVDSNSQIQFPVESFKYLISGLVEFPVKYFSKVTFRKNRK